MHPTARSGYLELLLESWQSEDCTISNDPCDLAEQSGLGDELWSVHGERILRNFATVTVQSPTGDRNRLRNLVVYEEWNQAKRVFEARQKSAHDTTRGRSPRGHRIAKDKSVVRSAYTQTGTGTITGTGTETGTENQIPLALSDAPASSPPETTVFDLPLVDKSEYSLPQTLFNEYVQAYPGVSVMAELAAMRSWIVSNPRKAKTRRGITAFMNSWLSRAQNDAAKRGGNVNGKQRNTNGKSADDVLRDLEAQAGANSPSGESTPPDARQAREPAHDGTVGPDLDSFSF